MDKQDVAIDYELASSDDEMLYLLKVRCKVSLSKREFAVFLKSLSDDILDGKLDDGADNSPNPSLN